MTALIDAFSPSFSPTYDISGWTCNWGFYGTGDGCDCNCGIPDPDCTPESTYIIGCEDNEICPEGVCIGIIPTESPTPAPTSMNPSSDPTSYPTAADLSDWTCNVGYYGTDDGCDCNCGLPDPDCTPETTKFYNCQIYETCVDAVCIFLVPTESLTPAPKTANPTAEPTAEVPTPAPKTPNPTAEPIGYMSDWRCSLEYYGANDGCDCNCGLPDPDCTPETTKFYNCKDHEICVDAVCVSNTPTESPTAAPTSLNPTPEPIVDMADWTCQAHYYGTGDGCDCNCGIPDPDCTPETTHFYNCFGEEICVNGVCQVFRPQSPTLSPPLKSDHEGVRDWFDRESSAGILVIGLTIMIILGVVVRYKKAHDSSSTPEDGNSEVVARELNGGPCRPESTKGINYVAHYSLKQEA